MEITNFAYLGDQSPIYFDPYLMTQQDMVYSHLLALCLEDYPEMDYILFPKIEVEKIFKQEEDGYLFTVELRGRAVRIKTENFKE